MSRCFLVVQCIVVTVLALGCSAGDSDIKQFSSDNNACFNRDDNPHTFVVDSHNHMRPFGGPAVPYSEQLEYFKKAGVLFVSVYGIGQRLPQASGCDYYLDCPGTRVKPSILDDLKNAKSLAGENAQGIHLTLAMTFADLARPEEIVPTIELIEAQYPGVFRWVGELNLVKQALFNNGHKAVSQPAIKHWKEFMTLLRERNMPLSLHSDLGNNEEPTKYQHLMEDVLSTYPDNLIVWHHMGLSEELTTIDPARHILIMREFLDDYPNLYIDIAWRVIADNYFQKPASRAMYVAFFNEYSDRIIPGTDFVASADRTFEDYQEEVAVNSEINQYLNDEAFRNIALGQTYFDLLGLDHVAPQICD